MMARMNVPHKIRYKLFRKAYKTSALLDSFFCMTCNNIEDTQFVHWGGSNLNFTNNLCVWGEAGTVKIKTKMTPKLDNHGVQCMFIRYAIRHTGDTYRMWDPKTGMHVSRDVIWLQQMFYKAKNIANYVEVNVKPQQGIHKTIKADEDDDSSQERSDKSSESSEIESESESVNASKDTPEDNLDNNQPDKPQEPQITRTRSGRAIQQPRRFVKDIGAGMFETLSKAEQGYYQRHAYDDDVCCYT
jgi:hypothetical protein